jgi:hypothetical protein
MTSKGGWSAAAAECGEEEPPCRGIPCGRHQRQGTAEQQVRGPAVGVPAADSATHRPAIRNGHPLAGAGDRRSQHHRIRPRRPQRRPDGVQGLWRGGTRWRVGARWYAAVLVVPGLAWGAASAVAAALGAEPPAFNPLVPALISGLLAAMLEEFGWSGLAFPTLQARYGFVRAGVAVGCIVAVWHLPFFLTPGDDPVQVVVPGLPADADPGKDHLRLDLQRVGRQHPVDGVVPRLGQRLVRGSGAGARRRRCGRADGHAGLLGGGHRRAAQAARRVSGRLLVTLLGSR